MSWEDKITRQMNITTGDSITYTVTWLNASKTIEWHGNDFYFLEVNGTLAKKKKLLGRKYPLEFYFQGPDHLDDYAKFERSLNDSRNVTIEHPLYNTIIVQIISLNVDDTTMNYSKVTCTAIETITEEYPQTISDPIDNIAQKKVLLDTTTAAELTQPPTITDVNTLNMVIGQNYKKGLRIVTIPSEAQDYINSFSTATNYVNTAFAAPTLAMQAVISLLTMPAKFTQDVKVRVNMLVGQFNDLRQTITGLIKVPSKQIYEVHGNTTISAMCLAASTPLTKNYQNSVDAINILTIITSNYNQYLKDMDYLQSPNGGNPNYYIPGFDALNQLNDIVNITISSLLQIALNGRQERSLVLTQDTNLIVLTHRLYSLDPTDANVDELSSNNNLTYKDMLGIDAGRKITYYI